MKALAMVLVILVLLLQYKSWLSDVGYRSQMHMAEEVARQQLRERELEEGNARLTAQVLALKNGVSALEARARSDLGMVKEDEVFYLLPFHRPNLPESQ